LDPFLSDVIAIFYLQLITHVIAKSTIWQMLSHRFNHFIIQIGVKSFFILVHNNFVVNAQISIDWKEVHLVSSPTPPKKKYWQPTKCLQYNSIKWWWWFKCLSHILAEKTHYNWMKNKTFKFWKLTLFGSFLSGFISETIRYTGNLFYFNWPSGFRWKRFFNKWTIDTDDRHHVMV
jgi:hypothetical protein